MKAKQLAESIGAEILTADAPDMDIERVYAGDRISDLLNKACEGTLLVTHLTGNQVLRLAELMDVPAVCVVDGIAPSNEVLAQAGRHGTLFMVSPLGMFETCGRLYPLLTHPERFR